MTEQSELLISLDEAAQRGIERLRQPQWANKLDHLKINIRDGRVGIWLRLFAPFNKQCNGRDPVEFLVIQADTKKREWLTYDGPNADSDEYKAEVAAIEADSKRLGITP